MLLTKRQVSPSTYEVHCDNPDGKETGVLKEGMLEGRGGTRVLLLDEDGQPQKGVEDPQVMRERSQNYVLIFLAAGALITSIAQLALLMSARAGDHVVSSEARARISETLVSSPEPESDHPYKYPWVRSE